MLTALSFAATSSAANVSVTMVGRAFQPSVTTVNVGDTVIWTNPTTDPHTVTDLRGLFNSGLLQPQTSFSFTFQTPGSYLYTCTIHPGMKGTIVVRGSSAGTPGSGSEPSGPGTSPQTVRVQLSKGGGRHGGQTLVQVQAPRPGAKVILELYSAKGATWRHVAQTNLSSQGKATLRLSSTAPHRLRVVVLGRQGEKALVSRALHAGG